MVVNNLEAQVEEPRGGHSLKNTVISGHRIINDEEFSKGRSVRGGKGASLGGDSTSCQSLFCVQLFKQAIGPRLCLAFGGGNTYY